MIKPLRKMHFYTWRFLLLAFPLAFFLALSLRPDQTIDGVSSSDFTIKATILNDSTQVIVVELKNPLRYPSCIVMGMAGDKKLILGSVSQKGIYEFKTLPLVSRIILVDRLKEIDIMDFSIKK